MAGSTFGNLFRITTWGESHGAGIGVVIDGCPAGLSLCEEDIQVYLDRRKPGQTKFATSRKESDTCKILSGVFGGKTTGTSIMVMVENTSQRSQDYNDIASYYRPGHADYTYDMKYGFRDYRGGGRSSGRETIGRVIAGAIAAKALKEMHIEVLAFTQSIGPISAKQFCPEDCKKNPFFMPDQQSALLVQGYMEELMARKDSAGGIISCIISGVPVGLGEPVFDKLDAELSKAVMSIGAIKGIEFGAGFAVSQMTGSQNNDAFISDGEGRSIHISKRTNHSGGVLGGMSDGSAIIFNAAVKPTPSIAAKQDTVTQSGEEIEVEIHGRHDPLVVPRAVVVVECMAAITVFDMLLRNMTVRMDNLKKVYFDL